MLKTIIYMKQLLLITILSLAWPFLTSAADTSKSIEGSPVMSQQSQSIWERDYLLGDWCGARPDLNNKGVTISLDYTAEVWGFVDGGLDRGSLYQGLFEGGLDFDFEKMMGWKGGSMRVNALIPQNSNNNGPTFFTGSGFDSSNISANDTARLFELWLQQDFLDDKLSLRAGQLAADDEFFLSETAGLFLGGNYGWGNNLASNIPNGGPAYPVAGLGVRVKVQPVEQFYVMSALFQGDVGDQATNNQHGTYWDLGGDQGIFSINEMGYLLNQEENAKGLPGSYKFGGWAHTGDFSSFLYDDTGLSLADPASSGIPALNQGTWGLYFIANQMVYRKKEGTDQGLSVFWRIAGGPDNTSTIPFYTDFGASYKGLIPCRSDDTIGVSFGVEGYSDDLATTGDQMNSLKGTNEPVVGNEAIIEATYQIQLAPWWYLQPDIQYIINPAGGALNPNTGGKIQNAVVIGLRTGLTF